MFYYYRIDVNKLLTASKRKRIIKVLDKAEAARTDI